MMPENGQQLTVPPGFRFHPTDEELLYYYLRKKVSYEAIDLDVIREVDLNKLEPWDLKEKCKIGSGHQNEWYFFSHKDKKYPTGTRTNRATTAGFWKATGRDKAIHISNSKRIGMRKTLVFYTGRAPHGQKTDWIMHEYRLDDDNLQVQLQEDGWVVCRVFKKKSHNRGFQAQPEVSEEQLEYQMKAGISALKNNPMQEPYDYNFDGSMHLPQLFSPESSVASPPFATPISLNTINNNNIECLQNIRRLASTSCGLVQQERVTFNTDWSFLNKLLASHQGLDQQSCGKCTLSDQVPNFGNSTRKFSFPYLGCEADIIKFSK